MLALTKTELPILFPRPKIVEPSQGAYSLERALDQPDIKRNPSLWLKLFLEGLTLHRRSLALAKNAHTILDLGCGSGWFSIAAGRAQPRAEIVAIDTDERLLNWASLYWDHCRQQHRAAAEIDFRKGAVEEFPWEEYEERFDLVHAGFILSRCKDPGETLQGIYRALVPGGVLIYHDATDPPPENLEALSRWSHRLHRWRDPTSDPWAWSRMWERRYKFDAVRALARTEEPNEFHVMSRIEELFAIRYQERRRAVLDIFLRKTYRSPTTRALLMPTLKFSDDLLCRTKLLKGACRYVHAQKR